MQGIKLFNMSLNMETKTLFTNKSSLTEECCKTLKKINYAKNEISKAFDENLLVLENDSFHFLDKILTPQTNFEVTFFAFIKRGLMQSEKLSGGSGKVFFDFFTDYLQNLLNHEEFNFNDGNLDKNFNELWENFKKDIETFNQPCNPKILENKIKKICQDDTLSKAIWKAVNLAGLEGKILVEDGKQENYIIETKEGYNFTLDAYRAFLVNETSWQRDNVKVLVIDGFVQNVSEISHILTKLMEEKEPLILFANEFSEESIATFHANKQKGNFEAIPIKIPPGLEGLNVVNDIATACNTFPISCLQGQMLTFVKYEELQTIDKITIKPDLVTIENKKSGPAVNAQIRQLMEKREDNKWLEDVVELLDQRMKALISNSVIILLPNVSKMENDSIRMKIDAALRSIKSTLNYGIIKKESLNFITNDNPKANNFLSNCFNKSLKQSLTCNEQAKYFDCLNLAIGTLIAGRIANMIFSANGLISKDN